MSRRIVISACILITLSLVSFFVVKDMVTESKLETSFIFPKSVKLNQFELVDQHGNVFTNENLMNKWSLLFVGFSSCNDICPATMAKLAVAYPKINKNDDLQIVFISVDPKRDLQKKLKAYVGAFNANFIAVTAGHEKLFPLVKELGLIYAMVGDEKSEDIDHSGSMVMISPNGEKVAIIKPKSKENKAPQIYTKDLIADVNYIKDYI